LALFESIGLAIRLDGRSICSRDSSFYNSLIEKEEVSSPNARPDSNQEGEEGYPAAAGSPGRRVQSAGCRVQGVGCGVWGVGCGVWGVGCGVRGLG
jgi:hypothetical protein